MTGKYITAIAIGLAAMAGAALAQTAPLAYTPDGKMVYPKDYRTWVFLSSGFDMSYVNAAERPHLFDNVFVTREAHDAFQKTGAWPDGTVLILEHRVPGTGAAVQVRGQFQTGPATNVEAHVKDASKGGWAFYVFGTADNPAAVMPKTAACYSCHQTHGATDTTFTQFYPTLAAALRK
jgi:hypothetical protein